MFQNNFADTLGAALASGGTTLTLTRTDLATVQSGDYMMLTLETVDGTKREIVKVTAHAAGSTTCTVQRAQEGTTAQTWAVGDKAEHRLTAGALGDLASGADLSPVMAAFSGAATINDGRAIRFTRLDGSWFDLAIGADVGTAWATQIGIVSTYLYDFAFGNGVWVGVGLTGTIITSSDNGATWVQQTSGSTANLQSVAFGNGVFVAVGLSGTILTSSDNGLTWTQRTGVNSNALYGVAYGLGYFVVSGASLVWRSSDGISWASIGTVSSTNLNGIAFDNGTFVIVGASGRIYTSNGISITQRNSGVSVQLYAAAFGNGKWVAVGINGTVTTSADSGVTWAQQTSIPVATNHQLYGVAYSSGVFVATGGLSNTAGLVFTSVDNGATWTQRVGITGLLMGVSCANGKFVTGGQYGLIFTSAA